MKMTGAALEPEKSVDSFQICSDNMNNSVPESTVHVDSSVLVCESAAGLASETILRAPVRQEERNYKQYYVAGLIHISRTRGIWSNADFVAIHCSYCSYRIRQQT